MSKDTKHYHEVRGFVSPKAEKWIRGSAISAMIIVALSSAILSFTGLQKLALESKIPEQLAFLFPIAVDVTILMGSLAVLLYEMFGLKAVFGWFTVLFGTLLSVTGNVISVANEGIIAQVLHGIIPILLCISLESLLRILRFNIKKTVNEIEPETYQHQMVDDESNGMIEIIGAPEDAALNDILETPEEEEQFDEKEESAVTQIPVVPADDIPQETIIAPTYEVRISEPTIVKPEVIATLPVEPTISVVEKKVAVQNTSKPIQKSKDSILKANNPSTPKKTAPSNLDDFQRDMLRDLVSSFPSDLSEAKKLSQVLMKQPDLRANDIRYIMKYPIDKRVDSLLKRARDIVLTENS